MLRAITVLSVAVVVLFVGTAAQQSKATRQTEDAPIVVAKKQPRATRATCRSAEKAIVYYRTEVWRHQEILGESKSKTYHPEKRKNACGYKRWTVEKWQAKHRQYSTLLQKIESHRPTAICYVFGQYCGQALTVARCESGYSYSIYAHNGQYLGMFQMGSYARARYGHGNTALQQARAAYRYFVDSGRDWSPWSCSAG